MAEVTIQDIRMWIESHRNHIIEDLGRIVNIRSVSEPGDRVPPFGEACRSVLHTMLDLAADKGFETENYEYYGGKIWFSSCSAEKEVGIWSHLDVVPEGEGWTFPPYEMSIVDDFLIGRGVQDNKSSAVGILYVLLFLKESGIPLHYNYALYTGCSEENTMDDVAYLTTHVHMPDISLVADCGFPVCYGEKGNLSVDFEVPDCLPEELIFMDAGTSANTIPEKASMVFDSEFLSETRKQQLGFIKGITVTERNHEVLVEAAGRAAHIINPEQGVNAVTILADGFLACGWSAKRYPWMKFLADSGYDGYGTGIGIDETDGISGPLVGGISGLSVQDRKLHIRANYRYPVLNSAGERSDGQTLIEKLGQTAKSYHLTMKIEGNSEAMYCSPDDPVVQRLTKSYHKHSGFHDSAYTMSGGTYARRLPRGMGFGMSLPGKRVYRPDPARPVGDFHQADESICISQLFEAMAIYAMCLIELR